MKIPVEFDLSVTARMGKGRRNGTHSRRREKFFVVLSVEWATFELRCRNGAADAVSEHLLFGRRLWVKGAVPLVDAP